MTVARLEALRERLRDPNPILVRELRSSFRTPRFVRTLTTTLFVLLLVVLGGGLSGVGGASTPADTGRRIFHVFFTVSYVLLAAVAPTFGASAFTSEKEQETYESVLLSGLSPERFVVGKVLASYVEIALLLVASVPILGVSFLFGGVSPLEIVLGFVVLLVAIAPGISLGVAYSSRLRSTRTAASVSLVTAAPLSYFALGAMAMVESSRAMRFPGAGDGPFAFVTDLATNILDPEAVLVLFVVPIVLVALATWLFVATAIAGVRPEAEDRVSPFKTWALATTLVVLAGYAALVARVSASEVRDVSLGLQAALLPFGLFLSLLFANEPPLPPRGRTEPKGLRERLLALVGPGSLGTARFASALLGLVFLAPLPIWICVRVLLRDQHGALAEPGTFVLSAMLAVGGLVVSLSTLEIGVFVRTLVGGGVASRAAQVGWLIGASVVPVIATLILGPDVFDRVPSVIPWPLRLSLLAPAFVAAHVEEVHRAVDAAQLLPFLGLYGGFALLIRYATHRRVAAARARVESAQSALLVEIARRRAGLGAEEARPG